MKGRMLTDPPFSNASLFIELATPGSKRDAAPPCPTSPPLTYKTDNYKAEDFLMTQCPSAQIEAFDAGE